MADDIDEEVRDLDIPADAAALVLYADGFAVMHLPKLPDDDNAEVPANALAIAAFGALVANYPARVQELVDQFMAGQLGDHSKVTH